MIHQLRIYEIFEGTRDAFLARFCDHAARIMRSYGFDFIAMWESRDDQRIEFVYLLRWPDEQAKNRAWEAFLADREWAEIKQTTRDQGTLVGKVEDRLLVMTDRSPAFA